MKMDKNVNKSVYFYWTLPNDFPTTWHDLWDCRQFYIDKTTFVDLLPFVYYSSIS